MLLFNVILLLFWLSKNASCAATFEMGLKFTSLTSSKRGTTLAKRQQGLPG